MAKYLVCRTFAERWRWTVEAESEEEALKMLDAEDESSPDGHLLDGEMAYKEWLGPVEGYGKEILSDNALLLEENPHVKKYSVLLIYPEYEVETGNWPETYYDHVEARTPQAAVAVAQERCMKTNGFDIQTARDCKPLLVTEGHNYGVDFT